MGFDKPSGANTIRIIKTIDVTADTYTILTFIPTGVTISGRVVINLSTIANDASNPTYSLVVSDLLTGGESTLGQYDMRASEMYTAHLDINGVVSGVQVSLTHSGLTVPQDITIWVMYTGKATILAGGIG